MSEDILHEMRCAVRDLALELGRTPTRSEFESQKGFSYQLDKIGGFTALLQASGLDTYSERRLKKDKAPKIDNSIFEKDLATHLEGYTPREKTIQEPWPTILSISDIHWPFCAQRVIDAFLKRVGEAKPEYVILNGDAWDMYSHSKFPRSANVFTPKNEQDSSRKSNEEFWKEVQKLSPKSQCIQMMGNHDIRPLKRIMEAYPEASDWVSEKLKSLFTFEGVKTIMDPREELMLPGNIAVFHGYRSQLGAHRDYTHCNTMNGHTHRGGAVFRQIRGTVLWELNSGVAGDPEAKGLTYTSQKISDWTPGYSEVDSRGPRFIPC